MITNPEIKQNSGKLLTDDPLEQVFTKLKEQMWEITTIKIAEKHAPDGDLSKFTAPYVREAVGEMIRINPANPIVKAFHDSTISTLEQSGY